MADEFQAGDTVELKSGGPQMTIESIHNYGRADKPDMKAQCVWFEGKKKQEAVFALHTLEKV